jgi:hypothetical protein
MAVDLCNSVDCGRAPPPAPRTPVPLPRIDLMAKDYDSLLRAMLDLVPARAPGWNDFTEADLAMALLELFAYKGDHASYLQDRVALEGFLRTATQYESVRKHLRLVDYTMYPGHAAATDLVIEATGGSTLFLPRGFQVTTPATSGTAAVVFETDADTLVVPGLSRMALALDAPANAARTELILASIDTAALSPGMRLLIQSGMQREIGTVASRTIGAVTTSVILTAPLQHQYPSVGPAAGRVHGNLARATHGRTISMQVLGTGRPAQRIALEFAPLTHVLDGDGVPRSTLSVHVDGVEYQEVEDFIDSTPADTHFCTTRNNAGDLTIHFGAAGRARMPASGADIRIMYRVGQGEEGRVAADSLTEFVAPVFADPTQRLVSLRNPLGTTAPAAAESLEAAKLRGPRQLGRQERAVTEADFERLALAGVVMDGERVQPLLAKARSRHTGGWHTTIVSLALPAHVPLSATAGLRTAFERMLDEHALAGTDVRVEDARYAPLSISLRVEVQPEYFARDVRQAVLDALIPGGSSARTSLSFLEPGRFTFGQPVYLSDLYAAVTAVEGVRSVAVTRFKRLGDRYPDREAEGFIAVGALEIARCDNDAAHTENGVLFVRTCGGKEG